MSRHPYRSLTAALMLFASQTSTAWLFGAGSTPLHQPPIKSPTSPTSPNGDVPMPSSTAPQASIHMYADSITPTKQLQRIAWSKLRDVTPILPKPQQLPVDPIDAAQARYGMPWRDSIDPDYAHGQPFYMPFWDWQIQFMKANLSNLRVVPTVDRENTTDLAYVENKRRKKRMVTLCFESDEYRLIRMTLMDAGSQTMVYTSLWYPRGNLPVLGIDLLQFNEQTRHLTVIDFQPIQATEEEHDARYEHLLKPIRDQYPSLHNRMTDRFYDESQFFSNQMLLGKGSSPDYVWTELFPAFQKYVATHVGLAKTDAKTPTAEKTDADEVRRQHAAYDDYSAERDPAHGLLKANFGANYADAFVYDVLFPLSTGERRS